MKTFVLLAGLLALSQAIRMKRQACNCGVLCGCVNGIASVDDQIESLSNQIPSYQSVLQRCEQQSGVSLAGASGQYRSLADAFQRYVTVENDENAKYANLEQRLTQAATTYYNCLAQKGFDDGCQGCFNRRRRRSAAVNRFKRQSRQNFRQQNLQQQRNNFRQQVTGNVVGGNQDAQWTQFSNCFENGWNQFNGQIQQLTNMYSNLQNSYAQEEQQYEQCYYLPNACPNMSETGVGGISYQAAEQQCDQQSQITSMTNEYESIYNSAEQQRQQIEQSLNAFAG